VQEVVVGNDEDTAVRLSIKALYELSKEENLAVLGKDGLPFNAVTSTTPFPYPNGEVYFFRFDPDRKHYDEEQRVFLDFEKFYEICIPSICWNDLIAGECEIKTIDGVRFIGIDIYNADLEKFEFV